VEEAAALLNESSGIGRVVPELGPPRRELLVAGYRLIYRVRTEVEILRLIHGRRDFLTAWREGR
jgi:plasmid stabilization system protein ParE